MAVSRRCASPKPEAAAGSPTGKDGLYLDKMHGDHIEVFKRCGKIMRTILNMDGTQNLGKLRAAGARDIVECIN